MINRFKLHLAGRRHHHHHHGTGKWERAHNNGRLFLADGVLSLEHGPGDAVTFCCNWPHGITNMVITSTNSGLSGREFCQDLPFPKDGGNGSLNVAGYAVPPRETVSLTLLFMQIFPITPILQRILYFMSY